MKMCEIEAILFDLDGTLLDSKGAFYLAICDFFKQHGLKPPTYNEVVSRISRMSLRSLLLSLLPSNLYNPRFVEVATRAIEESYVEFFLPKFATPIPGSAEFISLLKAKRVKTAIVTNGTSSMLNTYLQNFSVNVDAAISSDQAPLKPNPEGTLRVLAALNVEPEKALFCGDSKIDILTSKAAGVKITVGVLSGVGTRSELEKAGADFVIRDVHCLNSILKGRISNV